MYPMIATVRYVDEDDGYKSKTTYYALYANSLADAVNTIENYWNSGCVQGISAEFVDTEDVLFELPKELAEKYKKQGCFLFDT